MKRQSIGDKVVNVIFYIILGFFVILCFYPVWYAFLASFSCFFNSFLDGAGAASCVAAVIFIGCA